MWYICYSQHPSKRRLLYLSSTDKTLSSKMDQIVDFATPLAIHVDTSFWLFNTDAAYLETHKIIRSKIPVHS